MGLLKIAALIVIPVSGMTYMAFSLGKQLPKASRLFGNYIGLSYVYLKTILKSLKPEDKIPYDVLQVAKKASQQSQALRRELRNTIKKTKEDLQKKQNQILFNFQAKISQKEPTLKKPISTINDKENINKYTEKYEQTGSHLLGNLQKLKQQMKQKKKLKKQSRKFFQQL